MPADEAARLRRELAAFFDPSRWRSPMPGFENSGYALVEQVRAWQPRFVVDVGCGSNPFKGKIGNLIGIDLVNPAADLVCDLLDAPIRPGSVDVVLALGCINFGGQKIIEQQLRHVASWLTPQGRIVMRANPGLPTGPGLEFFPWSEANVDTLGATVGLHRDGPVRYDTYRNPHGEPEPRLVWHYRPGAEAVFR
ncbi:class I SAM-dependent methyltransferase [Micromonospora sp. KC606]|uniref:class I SAM-dependent methyltransferase n=1 Tax=Micromonospora sp. KC606 TaxID=2530379 RepID=UPI00104CB60C|nr:class I SAM-dependent methyltransferase [Micromonospora sp. KC606]TDC80872.1 class I SAM-dependent methyltransferase [Micromonospora sp. KC606]